jgi:leucine dehydrogenase
MIDLETLILDWDGEYFLTRFNRPTRTWMFIAIHSSVLGVPTGGTRLKTYGSTSEALRDAMRLAKGMTRKFALIDVPRGGAKAVLAVPKDFDPAGRSELMTCYGLWLASLKGIFETGADLGTNSADMDIISRHYAGVFGKSPGNGGAGDPGPETARGVFAGILASCDHRFGSHDLSGRTVLVQGMGSVGESLTRLLLEAGGRVKFSDVDSSRVEKIRGEYGLPSIDPEKAYGEPCDIFAPCGTGGILNSRTIPQLECSIVAGAANNQLEVAEDGEELHRRGILYAPDYIINAGGAIFLPAVEGWGWSVERARERVLKIGDTLKRVFARSKASGISTARAAELEAEERLSKASSSEGSSVRGSSFH